MALSDSIVWEVRTAGLDTNGGGFKAGASGTDYSLQDAKNTAGSDKSTTDAVTVGTGVITSVTASFTSAIVGNLIRLQGGTGTLAEGWYEVITFTSSTSITVDRNVAAGTGITMDIGGAMKTPGKVAGVKVAGNDVYIKNDGTHLITSTTANVASGRVDDTTGGTGSTNISHWIGYTSTRTLNNTDAKPLVQASGAITSFTIFTLSGVAVHLLNVSVDCASKSLTTGIAYGNNYQQVHRCKVANHRTKGIDGSTAGNSCVLTFCEVTGGGNDYGIYVAASMIVYGCESHDNAFSGFFVSPNAVVNHCLSYNNTGVGFDASSVATACIGCVSYGNSSHGFVASGNVALGAPFINCIAEGNGGEGFSTDGVADGVLLLTCAGYNNTSGNYSVTNILQVIGFVTGTTSFFKTPASGDFSLNSTAGGGAAAQSAGTPGSSPRGASIGYQDIGAIQHMVFALSVLLGEPMIGGHLF